MASVEEYEGTSGVPQDMIMRIARSKIPRIVSWTYLQVCHAPTELSAMTIKIDDVGILLQDSVDKILPVQSIIPR